MSVNYFPKRSNRTLKPASAYDYYSTYLLTTGEFYWKNCNCTPDVGELCYLTSQNPPYFYHVVLHTLNCHCGEHVGVFPLENGAKQSQFSEPLAVSKSISSYPRLVVTSQGCVKHIICFFLTPADKSLRHLSEGIWRTVAGGRGCGAAALQSGLDGAATPPLL